jgi:PilZ domain
MGEQLTVNRVDWTALRLEAHHGRRREVRKLIALRIEVCGFDRSGQFFTEPTETLDVSEGGCKFRLPRAVEKDVIVAIRLFGQNGESRADLPPVLFQIAYVRQETGQWTMGAAKLQSEPIWPVDFSKLDPLGTAAD